MVSPVSPTFQSMQHDKVYYIHGGDLVVLVENILFRVHRYFFERESTFFKTLFDAPRDETDPEPGSSDSSAIILDTTAYQFSRFVWVFYNPKLSLYDEASLEDWKSILELSHRWLFPEVKQLAIRELSKQPLSPVQRIELYHKNDVDRNFLLGDYIELCQRPQPLNLKEGLDLGLETTLMIAQAREEIRTPRSPEGVMTPLTPTLQGSELMGLIGKMFVTNEYDGTGTGTIGGGGGVTGQQQPERPVIKINGVPEPKGSSVEVKTPKATNGQNSGGSTNKTDKQNQSKASKKDPKKGNQQENPAKETTTTPTTTTTTSPTAETKKTVEKGRNHHEDVLTAVAGQQGGVGGAGTGGTDGEPKANGENGNGNGNGSSMEPGATTTNGSTEAGPKKVEGAQDVENAGGTGDSLLSNGNTENEVGKNKTTDTQPSPTTANATGAGGDQDNSNSQQGTGDVGGGGA